jgi:trk system potassium uptake protein TrkH
MPPHTYKDFADQRKFRSIQWGLILSLSVASLTLFVAPLVALTYPYFDEFSALSLTSSVLLLIVVKTLAERAPKASVDTIIKALVFFWFFSPLILTLFFSKFANVSLIDAYFEMVSGLSGTGLTILNPSKVTPFVNAFRAASQWSGEVGALFLTLILALVYHVSPTGIVSALGKGERVRPSMFQTLKDLVMIYIVLTLIPITYMYMSGMSLYNSIVYTFAALATGGFAPTNMGAGDLMFWQQVAVMVTCILGALNFSIYLNLRYGKVRRALLHPELKLMLGSILFYALLLLALWEPLNPLLFWNALFHSASAVTTSGFSIVDVSKFNQASKFVLIIAMLIGASAFSTGGGIKLYRIYVLGKFLSKEVKSVGKPGGLVKKVVVLGREISYEDLAVMMMFITLYLLVFLALSLVVIELVNRYGLNVTPIDVMFEVSSAMSGTGLTSGLTLMATPDIKLILCIAIVLGKLEILPIIYVLSEVMVPATSLFKNL